MGLYTDKEQIWLAYIRQEWRGLYSGEEILRFAIC